MMLGSKVCKITGVVMVVKPFMLVGADVELMLAVAFTPAVAFIPAVAFTPAVALLPIAFLNPLIGNA